MFDMILPCSLITNSEVTKRLDPEKYKHEDNNSGIILNKEEYLEVIS